MQWYYAKNNEQLGPIDNDEFQRLIDADQILPTDLVWNTTLPDWTPAASIAGLFPNSVASLLPTYDTFEPTTTDFAKLTGNHDLLQRSKISLQNNWGAAAGIYLLYFIISYAIANIPLIGSIAPLIISGPFSLGICLFFLTLVRKSAPTISQLFDGFKTFEISMVTYIFTVIFTLLWSLLLIIPGIIASISYSMAYYIIIDNPNISAMDAITRSKEMMMGNKMKYFCMQWRFFGWILLALATFGIGFIWLTPYMFTANAEFYEDLRKAQQSPAGDDLISASVNAGQESPSR